MIIPERISVHLRPKAANQRLEAGHFEGDLTFCKGNQSSNIMVITERVSRFSLLIKNNSKNAKEVGKNLFNTLAPIPKIYVNQLLLIMVVSSSIIDWHVIFLVLTHTFVTRIHHGKRARLKKPMLCCIALSLNQLSLTPLDEISLKNIQDQFNSVPRRILGYKTPAEIFNQLLQDVALRT